MQQQSIHTHHFPNGLMLIVEEMKDVQSAAFTCLVPAGSIFEPEGQNGNGSFLCDWLTRGAGDRDSRELSAALDNLGLQHNEHIGSQHVSFGGATIATRLPDSIRIYSDVIRRPHLPEDEFDAVRDGIEQSLKSLEDEPQRKATIELRRRSFTHPWSRPVDGTLEDLPNITVDTVRNHYTSLFRPNDCIIGIAGNVDVMEMIDVVGEAFGDWQAKTPAKVTPGGTGPKRDFIQHESSQTHIGVAYDSVSYPDPDYYTAWAAVSVLSGGMSARLFTEIREKRGLCYSVYASQAAMKHEGRVLCYAGSSNDRAQETLDVLLQELKKLGDGIQEEELARCKARAKSSLIMQQESTGSRAGSIARDWFLLGRVTTLQEVRDRVDELTVPMLLDYVHRKPAQDFTVLTIGPKALEVNES